MMRDNDRHQEALNETGFWGRRGAGAVVVAKSSGRLLLQLRGDEVCEPSTWGTWGGAIDSGEDGSSAVRRELREELGLAAQFELIHVWDFRSGSFVYENFVALVDDEFDPDIPEKDAWETAGWEWFDIDLLPEGLHPGASALLESGRLQEILADIGNAGPAIR